jgi:hypothetical protein
MQVYLHGSITIDAQLEPSQELLSMQEQPISLTNRFRGQKTGCLFKDMDVSTHAVNETLRP